MRLKCHNRIKDGKDHRYWSIVESVRCSRARVVQRHVLYLGELNDSQREGWTRCLDAIDGNGRTHETLFRPTATTVPLVVVFCSDMGVMEFAYYDTSDAGGLMLEFLHNKK
jgi:hypothetical protein